MYVTFVMYLASLTKHYLHPLFMFFISIVNFLSHIVLCGINTLILASLLLTVIQVSM